MKTSAEGRAAITQREGRKLQAYKDSVGVWTIGVGHTAAAGAPAPKAGMKITAAECDTLLAHDLATFEAFVNDAVTVALEQHEFDACVSLAFNIGAGAFAHSSVAGRLNANDKQGAADAFLKWNKAGGRVLAGLTTRRKAERLQFLGGADAEDGGDTAPKLAPYEIKAVQQRLIDLKYTMVGVADGVWGARTTAGVAAFQHSSGLPVTGALDDATREALAQDSTALSIGDDRANATATELAPHSPIIQDANTLIGGGVVTAAALPTITGGLDFFGKYSDTIKAIQDTLAHLPAFAWGVLGSGVVAAGIYYVVQIRHKRVLMHQNGETA